MAMFAQASANAGSRAIARSKYSIARIARLRRVLGEPPPALQEEAVGLDVLRRLASARASARPARARPRARRRSAARHRSGSRRCPSSAGRTSRPTGADRFRHRRASRRCARGLRYAARFRRAVVVAPSVRPISFRLCARCLNGITEVREITWRARIFDRCAMTSSVIPSAKYSCSGSAPRLRNGSTATEGNRARPAELSAGWRLRRRAAQLLRQRGHVRIGLQLEVRSQAPRVLAPRAGSRRPGRPRRRARASAPAHTRPNADRRPPAAGTCPRGHARRRTAPAARRARAARRCRRGSSSLRR